MESGDGLPYRRGYRSTLVPHPYRHRGEFILSLAGRVLCDPHRQKRGGGNSGTP